MQITGYARTKAILEFSRGYRQITLFNKPFEGADLFKVTINVDGYVLLAGDMDDSIKVCKK